jgi:hypothetical protein
MHAAVFNVARRTAHQILYWLPPLLLGYTLMAWATERYGYVRAGRTWRLIQATETNTSTRNQAGLSMPTKSRGEINLERMKKC